MEIGLSLGANLGDRLGQLQRARDAIAALPGIALLAQAPVYETEPVGVKPEYAHLKFLNTVLIIRGEVSAEALQRALGGIEEQLGRARPGDRFAPRDIDIDILYAGEIWMESDSLTLPHPRWARRRFVVQPLADVRPQLVLPGAGRTVRDMLDGLPVGEAVEVFVAAEAW